MAVDFTKMKSVLTDVLNAYFTAQHGRIGFPLDDSIAKGKMKALQDQFATAQGASDVASATTVFNKAIDLFTTEDKLYNFWETQMPSQNEMDRKDREARFRKLFAQASA
jgi:hypothetical protein